MEYLYEILNFPSQTYLMLFHKTKSCTVQCYFIYFVQRIFPYQRTKDQGMGRAPYIYHEGTFELIEQGNTKDINKYCNNVRFANTGIICVRSILPPAMIFHFERDGAGKLQFGWHTDPNRESVGPFYQGMVGLQICKLDIHCSEFYRLYCHLAFNLPIRKIPFQFEANYYHNAI